MAKQTNASAKEAPQFQAPKKKKKWLKRIIALTVIVALLAGILPAHASGTWWRGKEKSIAGTAKREEGAV